MKSVYSKSLLLVLAAFLGPASAIGEPETFLVRAGAKVQEPTNLAADAQMLSAVEVQFSGLLSGSRAHARTRARQ